MYLSFFSELKNHFFPFQICSTPRSKRDTNEDISDEDDDGEYPDYEDEESPEEYGYFFFPCVRFQ